MIYLDAIPLPSGLEWVDEFTHADVSQTIKRTLTGAMVVVEQAAIKGREITLQGDQQSTWITKANLALLLTKINTADLVMTLDYHGTPYSVMFRRTPTAMDAALIVPFSNPQSDDVYSITLRLIEV